MIPCNFTSDIDRYERDQVAADDYDDFIDSLADDLLKLGAECDPFLPANFQEAIAQQAPDDLRLICEALRHEWPVTRNLRAVSVKYWTQIARTLAEKRSAHLFRSSK